MQSGGAWHEGILKTSDGTGLFYRVYRPQNPRKSLILFHGFGEHSYRYEKFSQHFPDFQIAIYDARGMGRSEGRRVDVQSFSQFIADAREFVDFLDKQYPVAVPRVFLGHSMGALLLMALYLDQVPDAERFVFSAPCFRVAVPDVLLGMNRFLAKFMPRVCYHNPVYYRNLTHDAAEMYSYQTDTYIMRKMTMRLLAEMTTAGEAIANLPEIRFQKPVHFLLAGDDKLVRTKVAETVYARIVAPQKTLKIYENFYHEIFNESGQNLVFQDLAAILD